MPNEQAHWYDFPEIKWETLFHPTFAYHYFRQPIPADSLNSACASAASTPVAAAWAADAAMLAYGRSGPNDMSLLEFDEVLDGVGLRGHRIGNWSRDAKSVKAIFAYNPQMAVLAFRGTKKINWLNSAVDLAAFPATELSLAESSAEGTSGVEAEPRQKVDIRVHSGFQFALNTAWEDIELCIESYRAKYPLSPILFAGHSLGAAFATMAVARFAGGRAALYTFGSPRVGNRGFCEHVRRCADLGVFRFVNNRDLMTTVPPREKSFEHTCGLMHIDADGNIKAKDEVDGGGSVGVKEILFDAAAVVRGYLGALPPPPELIDHAQRRYCYYLWRWARQGQVP